MPTVSTDADAYQSLDDIRSRIDHQPADFFDDNEAIRFDELLVRLEGEARGIFETLWGDETPLEETDRVDSKRATDDAAIPLVYPVQSVAEVEIKQTLASDWRTLDTERYDVTDHRLILAERPNTNTLRLRGRDNALTQNATRATWRDICARLRVTYDRGFVGGAPVDVKSIQIQLINQLLRKLKREQTVSAASPEELSEMTNQAEVVTEEIRARISDVTSPSRATQSI
jgi:hypothetical protein